jgi:transcriptional regulator with XRE-family HTH domain
MMIKENSVPGRHVLRDLLDDLKRLRQCERDEDLARLIGIAPSTLSHYRSGSRCPGLDNCERIAFLLGVNPEQVIDAVKTGRRCTERRDGASGNGEAGQGNARSGGNATGG